MIIGESQQQLFLGFVEAALQPILTTTTFETLIREKVRPLLPHKMCVAVIGKLSFDPVENECMAPWTIHLATKPISQGAQHPRAASGCTLDAVARACDHRSQ